MDLYRLSRCYTTFKSQSTFSNGPKLNLVGPELVKSLCIGELGQLRLMLAGRVFEISNLGNGDLFEERRKQKRKSRIGNFKGIFI